MFSLRLFHSFGSIVPKALSPAWDVVLRTVRGLYLSPDLRDIDGVWGAQELSEILGSGFVTKEGINQGEDFKGDSLLHWQPMLIPSILE